MKKFIEMKTVSNTNYADTKMMLRQNALKRSEVLKSKLQHIPFCIKKVKGKYVKIYVNPQKYNEYFRAIDKLDIPYEYIANKNYKECNMSYSEFENSVLKYMRENNIAFSNTADHNLTLTEKLNLVNLLLNFNGNVPRLSKILQINYYKIYRINSLLKIIINYGEF